MERKFTRVSRGRYVKKNAEISDLQYLYAGTNMWLILALNTKSQCHLYEKNPSRSQFIVAVGNNFPEEHWVVNAI